MVARCESASKWDPAADPVQHTDVAARISFGVGSQSAPIGTPPRGQFPSQFQGFDLVSAGVPLACRFTSAVSARASDHGGEWPFARIVKVFVAIHGQPAVTREPCEGSRFDDPAVAEKFREFHNERAQLRIVHRNVN
jgi:hypothetical protein